MATFCNTNPIVTKASFNFFYYFMKSDQTPADTIPVNSFYSYAFYHCHTSARYYWAQRKAFGVQFEEFIHFPSFNGANLNVTDFSWYYDKLSSSIFESNKLNIYFYQDGNRGNCYSFNSGTNYLSKTMKIQK